MKFIKSEIKLDTDLEDASWAYFSKNFLIRKIYLMRLKRALKLVGKTKVNKILDLGTGCGILIPSLNKYGKVYATDYKKKFLEKAKKLCKSCNINAEFSKFNINEGKLPYQDDYFDIIISLSVLEHIRNLDDALSEINRILKQNGILIIGVPVEEFLVKLFFKQQKISDEVNEIHVQNYNGIENGLKKYFNINKIDKIPFRLIPDKFSIYKIFKCVKR